MSKRLLSMAALVLSVGVLTFTGSASAQSIMSGTAHDLRARLTITEICVVCHTPHNSAATADQLAPLWNHETTLTNFTVYTNPSGTLQSTPGDPQAVSRACLSCHDGTIAIDNYGGVTTGTDLMTGNTLLGTDLSNDHPVSMVYDTSLANNDGALLDPNANANPNNVGADSLPLFGSPAQVECASCHNVHDDTNGSFLRVSNTASALCINCHIK